MEPATSTFKLLEKARSGDEPLSRAFKKHRRLAVLIQFKLSPPDSGDAEDVLHETSLRAFCALD